MPKEKKQKMKKKSHKIIKIILITFALVIALVAIIGFIFFRRMNAPLRANLNASEDAVATTTAGLVKGAIDDGIYVYLGMPYAEAKERFVRAEALEPWDGVREYTEYGAISLQSSFMGMGGTDNQDNNCQNLNLWTLELNDGGKRPVMVWLHGGGFSSGSANEASTNGKNLAKEEDVVVVTVNHRLGAAGYLNLSAFDEKYKDSANVGMWDVIDALTWIQDNIEYFGGDPDNVTIFGQSGGGAKVLTLMSTPYAKGLFHKGINQSGTYDDYKLHYVIGFVYDRLKSSEDGQVIPYSADTLSEMKCPYGNVRVWVQEKYKITGLTEKSGNTTNIGSITSKSIDKFINGKGPFSALNKCICDDYWRNYKKKTTYKTVEEYFIWAKDNSELSIDFDEQKGLFEEWRRKNCPSKEDLLIMALKVLHAKGPKGGEKGLWAKFDDKEICVASKEPTVSEYIVFCNDNNIEVINVIR